MHRIARFLSWYASSRTAFSVHSPLLYSLCTEVLDDNRGYYAFESIEHQRSLLLSSAGDSILNDLAGTSSGRSIKLADSLQRAATPSWKGQFLFRLAQWWKPDAILEVGTHLGFGTAYLASARKGSTVWTIDQSTQAQEIAKKLWNSQALDHIKPICDDMKQGLDRMEWDQGQRWLIYLDADHRSNAVEQVIQTLETKLESPFLIAIDDIRWSVDMHEGWKKWCSTRDGAWIDLFQLGLWIADPSFLEPVRMSLIPRKWKPLRLGWI